MSQLSCEINCSHLKIGETTKLKRCFLFITGLFRNTHLCVSRPYFWLQQSYYIYNSFSHEKCFSSQMKNCYTFVKQPFRCALLSAANESNAKMQ